MPATKAIFKNVSDQDKVVFKRSRCLMTISVGQQTHEEEWFSSTISLVDQSFRECTILVDDSLQRHTMALVTNNTPEELYDISIQEGSLWLERNKQVLESLTIPVNIMRWNHWLEHFDFVKQQEEIKKSLEDDVDYSEAFDESIEEFLDKYTARYKNEDFFDIDRARAISINFVLEECAALCLWTELDCQFEVYPNAHNKAIEETKKKFVFNRFPDLLRSVTVGFRNARQLNPQKFHLLMVE